MSNSDRGSGVVVVVVVTGVSTPSSTFPDFGGPSGCSSSSTLPDFDVVVVVVVVGLTGGTSVVVVVGGVLVVVVVVVVVVPNSSRCGISNPMLTAKGSNFGGTCEHCETKWVNKFHKKYNV